MHYTYNTIFPVCRRCVMLYIHRIPSTYLFICLSAQVHEIYKYIFSKPMAALHTPHSTILHLIPAHVIDENTLDELLLVDLAHGIPRNVIDDPHDLRDFICHQAILEGAPQIQRAEFRAGEDLRVEDHDGADFLAPVPGRHRAHGALGDLGQG